MNKIKNTGLSKEDLEDQYIEFLYAKGVFDRGSDNPYRNIHDKMKEDQISKLINDNNGIVPKIIGVKYCMENDDFGLVDEFLLSIKGGK